MRGSNVYRTGANERLAGVSIMSRLVLVNSEIWAFTGLILRKICWVPSHPCAPTQNNGQRVISRKVESLVHPRMSRIGLPGSPNLKMVQRVFLKWESSPKALVQEVITIRLN